MAVIQTLERDNLVAGKIIDAVPVKVAASQSIFRGQVLSYDSGAVSVATATGTPYGIAASDITTGESETDKSVPVYMMGVFNKDAIVFADGATEDNKAAQLLALRNIGIITTAIVEA